MKISGMRAIVVGGASGIGRASAELFAERGACVAILDRSDSAGPAVAAGLGGAFHATDVTDFAGTEHALDEAVSWLGGLDAIVTTAGGGVAGRTLDRNGPHDLRVFRDVLELNAVATFNISRLAAAHMAGNEPTDGERGIIINTSSIAAFEGQIGQVAYSAAKAAIAGMCLTMARDLGPFGIRVCAIAPSLFDTGAIARMDEETKAALVDGAAFPRRMGRPVEYAKLAAAIVDNPMLNGQCLRLDAGQRLGPK
ncbi:MAG TPA: SDR family NAD(P)-dependent oxidoreductase [Pseudonocardiaceae bacterium]|jgi:NAD(P)-dependent dehydrogenase (short-subunit alcohol dehydrogenase family)|nr:SDR family NAD(P)-dependent oxidoreductase [Pseudonocardiaceae bacterium]